MIQNGTTIWTDKMISEKDRTIYEVTAPNLQCANPPTCRKLGVVVFNIFLAKETWGKKFRI